MKSRITPILLFGPLALFACDAEQANPRPEEVADVSAETTPDTTSPSPADTTGDGTQETTPPTTDRLRALVEFGPRDALFTVVPDLDGDGRADLVTSSHDPAQVIVQTGSTTPTTTELGYVRQSTGLTVAVADLNHDGAPDLVLSGAFDHKVEVYFGPFDGVAKPSASAFRLSRDPGGGLSDRFGGATLAVDLSGDGGADLLVTSPGEGEEACAGTRATLVYFGPLAPGPASAVDGMQPVGEDEDDGPAPSRVLPATPGACLGDYAFVLPASRGQALVLSLTGAPSGRVAYGLPLSAEPIPLTEENSPALPALGTRVDIDDDGVADTVGFDAELGGAAWTRSSDGERLSIAESSHFARVIGVDLDGDGVGAAWILAERFESSTYSYDVVLAPVPDSATGPVDFATLSPSWRGERSAYHNSEMSRGDLDGDGVPEVAVGNALIRSRSAD